MRAELAGIGAAALPGNAATTSPREATDLLVAGLGIVLLIAASGIFKQLGLVTPVFAAVYLCGGILMFGNLAVLIERWPAVMLVMLFPLVCLFSTFWSADAGATLRHAAQLCFTAMLGVTLGLRLAPQRLMHLLTVALGACVLASLLNLGLGVVPSWMQDDFVGARRNFKGLYDHKNSMGHVLYLLVLCVLYQGHVRGRTGPGLLGALALGPLIHLTGSSTAMLLYAVTLSMPLVSMALSWSRSLVPLVLGCVTVAALCLFAAEATDQPLVQALLDLLGKNATLTGRTVLWEFAVHHTDQAPLLGVGYQVFWSTPLFDGDVTAIHAAVLDSIDNFHNAFVEALVGTGLIGMLSLAATLIAVWMRWQSGALTRQVTPTHLAIVWLLLLISVRSMVEATLHFQHQLDFLLMSMIVRCAGGSAAAGVPWGRRWTGARTARRVAPGGASGRCWRGGRPMNRRIAIAIATLDRPLGLAAVLHSIARLDLPASASVRVLVIDNSAEHTASACCDAMAAIVPWPLELLHETRPGLSHARNAALLRALEDDVDELVFVDDDEVVDSRWLSELLRVRDATAADAVIGRVLLACHGAPSRVARAGFALDDQRADDAAPIAFGYTGNALLAMGFVQLHDLRFDARLTTSGGEDVHFFRTLRAAGGRIVFAANALSHEFHGPDRQRFGWWLRRWFRSANSSAYSALISGETSRAALLRGALVRALVGLSGTLITLPLLVVGHDTPLRYVRMLCRATGQFGTGAGFQYQEYSARNRRAGDLPIKGNGQVSGR